MRLSPDPRATRAGRLRQTSLTHGFPSHTLQFLENLALM